MRTAARRSRSLCLVLAGCGDKPAPAAPKAPPPGAPARTRRPPPAAAGDADHGAHVDLGHLTLAGHELDVLRLGDVVPGKESAFEVGLVKGPAGAELGEAQRLPLGRGPGRHAGQRAVEGHGREAAACTST